MMSIWILAICECANKGSDGGHNGLRDIQEKLGSNQYPRLRIGIGANFSRGRQADYVLSPGTLMKNICYRVLLTEQQKQ
jgi:peptidyl-tRNA hydrolase